MNGTVALFVITWAALVLLTIGFAGLLRAVRLLDRRVAETYAEPRRVSAGDRVTLPANLRNLSDEGAILIAFLRASCASCRSAATTLDSEWAEGRIGAPIALLWEGDAPNDVSYTTVSLEHQLEVFDLLKVGITPFAILVDGGVVTARGGIGDSGSLRRILDHVPERRDSGRSRLPFSASSSAPMDPLFLTPNQSIFRSPQDDKV